MFNSDFDSDFCFWILKILTILEFCTMIIYFEIFENVLNFLGIFNVFNF